MRQEGVVGVRDGDDYRGTAYLGDSSDVSFSCMTVPRTVLEDVITEIWKAGAETGKFPRSVTFTEFEGRVAYSLGIRHENTLLESSPEVG